MQVFEYRASEALPIKRAPGEGSENPNCRRDHLIHRKRSPFPYEGKALTPVKLGVTCDVGRGTSHARRAKRCRGPGGAKPIAGVGVGWRGSPLRTDSRRGQRLPTDIRLSPAPARQRRAQVCGEITVIGAGKGKQPSPAPVLAPHPPRSGPPSPRGKGLKSALI